MSSKRISMAERMAHRVQPLEEASAELPSTPEAGVLVMETVVEPVGDQSSSEQEELVATTPAVVADGANSVPPNSKAPRKTGGRKLPVPISASTPAESVTVGLAIEIEPELDARFEAYRLATRISYHHIVLDAVEKTYSDLPALVTKALGRDIVERPATSLFGRTTTPAPINTEGRRERVVHTVRITLSRREILDQVAAEVGAPSRNFMISVALDKFLPGG